LSNLKLMHYPAAGGIVSDDKLAGDRTRARLTHN
jgi:hypothetical protein